MSNAGYVAFVLGIVAAIIVAMVIFANQANDCSAKGGVLVRGAFGYSCVAAAK